MDIPRRIRRKQNPEKDVFWPDDGFPVSDWYRKFAWRTVKTEDHGDIRWRFVYERQIRMYKKHPDRPMLRTQYVQDLDA